MKIRAFEKKPTQGLSLDKRFPLPKIFSQIDETSWGAAKDRKYLLDGPTQLTEIIKFGVNPTERKMAQGFLLIEQAGNSMSKEAGFLFLSFLAEPEFLGARIAKQFRDRAISVRQSLYERYVDPEKRLKSKIAESANGSEFDQIFSNFLDFVRQHKEQPAEPPTPAPPIDPQTILRNFNGYLIAEAVDGKGKALPRSGKVYLLPAGEKMGLKVRLGRKAGTRQQVSESVIVEDGQEPDGKPVRFDLSMEAAEGEVKNHHASVLLKKGEPVSSEGHYKYAGKAMQKGEHLFWVSCYQGYHFLQGMEITVRVIDKVKK
jgi:hypothetical protein